MFRKRESRLLAEAEQQVADAHSVEVGVLPGMWGDPEDRLGGREFSNG